MNKPAIDFRVLKRPGPHSGIACVSIMRNERYFVPHFLSHYRNLGIDRFIIYDDDSSDGTREYLMSQDDCTVMASDHDYHDKMDDGRLFHYHARALIAENYCPDEWHLVVDADEFLFLPSNYSKLPDVIRDLEARGEICAIAAMIDLYPRTLAERNYSADLGPLERRGWWFDREAGFRRNPYTDQVELVPKGVRARLLQRLALKHPEILPSIFPKRPSFAKLWKVPLLKQGKGIAHRDSHSLTVIPPTEVQLALAHFKFYPRLDRKIEEALRRESYWKSSREYRFLAAAIEHLGDDELVSSESHEFSGARSLEDAGLMFSHPPRARSAPARTAEVCGAPLVYARLGDADARGELSRRILGEYRAALEAGYPEGRAWQTNLAPIGRSKPIQGLLQAVTRMAESTAAPPAPKSGKVAKWSAAAVAVVLPPGGAAIEVATKGLWSALYHLRVDAGPGGQAAFRDARAARVAPRFGAGQPDDSAALEEVGVTAAAGLLLLFPSWCGLSLTGWQGKGWRVSVVVELTPAV